MKIQHINIENENIIEDSKYLILRLRDMYKAAWYTYGWESGVGGIGLSETLINRSIQTKKKILVKHLENRYEITGKKAYRLMQQYMSKFKTSNGTVLYIIPLLGFDKLPDQVVEEQYISPLLGLAKNKEKWEALRLKLHSK